MEEEMSQMPMGSATDESGLEGGLESRPASGDSHHPAHTQASMFDEPVKTAGLEAYTSTYEQLDELRYDPLEDFSQESMETDLQDVMEQEATSFEAHELTENHPEHLSTEESTSEPEPNVAPPGEQPVGQPAATLSPAENVPAKDEVVPPSGAAVAADAVAEPQHVTVLTADDFAALEDRILRAVGLVKREREARMLAESQLAALEAQKLHVEAQTHASEARAQALEEQVQALEALIREHQAEHQAQSPVMERLEREVDSLRAEREQVRQRVERLLGQLDALEL
jgi:hypothetical protein